MLMSLQSTLSSLETFLHGDDARGSSFECNLVLYFTIGACRTRLDMLHGELKKIKAQHGRIEWSVQRLMWPLKETEHRKAIQDLQGFI